MIRSEKQLGGM